MSLSTLAQIDLRAAFRPAASSAWVVTGHGPVGPVGFTAISVISVSVAPAIVSFNLSKTSSSLAAIDGTRRAALHLLSHEQAHLATRFAANRESRFVDDGLWSIDEGGLPRLHDVVTRLTVDISDLVDAGDSYIAISHVVDAETTDRSPLVHHDRGFLPLTTTSIGA